VVEGSRLTTRTYGVLRTQRQPGLTVGTDLAKRVGALARAFDALVEEWRPEHAAIEEFRYYGRSVTSSLQLANVTGMLRELLRARGIPVAEYSAREIRHRVAQDGNADKKRVQEMVRLCLGMPTVPKPQHASDALACCIAHASQLAQQGLIKAWVTGG